MLNFVAAWIGVFLGFFSGALIGLFFHQEQWSGGYFSWKRRMIRLGHISFFGLAAINLFYALSVKIFELKIESSWPSYLFVFGAVTMPLVCFFSAFKKVLRHLFCIPVLSLIIASFWVLIILFL